MVLVCYCCCFCCCCCFLMLFVFGVYVADILLLLFFKFYIICFNTKISFTRLVYLYFSGSNYYYCHYCYCCYYYVKGEKQRIAIVRSLYRKPQLVVIITTIF